MEDYKKRHNTITLPNKINAINKSEAIAIFILVALPIVLTFLGKW